MAKQLHELLQRFSEMNDDEALEHIRKIRHTKHTIKPAAIERKAKQERKKTQTAKSKLDKLLEGMSPEEKAAFLKQLEGDE